MQNTEDTVKILIAKLMLAHNSTISRNQTPKEDQEGEVRAGGTYLLPQTYQKYVYMWLKTNWKLSERLLYNQDCQ